MGKSLANNTIKASATSDDKLPLAGGVMTGDIELGGNKLKSSSSLKLKTGNNNVDFVGVKDILRHNLALLNGFSLTSPIIATWQNKSGIVAYLDDLPQNNYFFSASDEDSDLSADTSNAAYTDYLPYKVDIDSIMISVNSAPTGSSLEIDIKKNETSIFTTKPTIDAGHNTNLTASTAYTLNGSVVFNAGDKLEAFITQVGINIAGKGLKIKILGK